MDLDVNVHEQLCPNARVEITGSTIHAYAHTRGVIITKYDPPPDPLHSALYSLRSRSVPQVEVNLPRISDMTRIEP
jgi:hypothetical protein